MKMEKQLLFSTKLYAVFMALLFGVIFFTKVYPQGFTYYWGHPSPQGNMVYAATFKNANTGWAVTAGGNILKTTDEGLHWSLEKQSDSLRIDYFDIVHTQQGTLLISGDSGMIMRSTDEGKTWNSIQFKNTGRLFDLELIPGGGISAAGEEGTLLVSDDDGITWVDKGPEGSGYARHHCWKSATEAYIVGFNMFFRTLDGGNSWNVVDTLLGFGVNEIFFVTDKLGYALEDFHYYKTTDGGNTWIKTEDFSEILYQFRTLVIDELHWFRVAFGEGGEFWETTDGGIHWTEHFTYNTVGFINLFTNGTRIFFTSDTGDFFYTDDNGLTIKNSITNLSTEPSAPITIIGTRPDGTAFANNQPSTGTENQTFYRSGDGGKSWHVPEQVPGLRWIYDIYFLNNQQGVVGSYSDIRYTLDGGTTWNSSLLPDEYRLTNFDSPNHDEYFAAAYLIKNSQGFGNIYKSTDQGITWQRVAGSLPLNGLYFPSISFADSVTGYISYLENNVNKFYKSTDAGQNWFKLSAKGISDYVASMLWISADTGFAAVPNGTFGIYKTVDGGLNWLKVSENGARILTTYKTGHIAALNPQSNFFQETTDLGENWTYYYPPMAAHYPGGDRSIQSIHATPDGYLIGGTSNRLMLATRDTGVVTGITPPRQWRNSTENGFLVFPNIINQTTNSVEISIEVKTGGFVRLELKDMQGRTLKTLLTQIITPGTHSFRFNAQQLFGKATDGTYLLTLKTTNSINSQKLLYVKRFVN
ncbi:MAG TPA: hypothetical protein DCQ26_05915 [Marinilabiliales bacterium]|nr:MAG: hypothetical protein A2437_17065 [Bacteroidetes bacterium RIFOXYC2_FULL_40_12]HAM98127.1 hypothetical protein [Marinilabiliales bacterium]HBX85717.1 hypothetical protein [Marinilabiliales bacterium]HBY51552.1 hypothetical protein [Marinilabiliales bacterium]HCC29159.1 hypothetical protein [Marinilabiliales bacterium]